MFDSIEEGMLVVQDDEVKFSNNIAKKVLDPVKLSQEQ